MDISYQNILIKKSIWDNGEWVYNVNNRKYFVNNHGFQIGICDFGACITDKFELNEFEKKIFNKCIFIDLYNFLMYLNPKYFEKHKLEIYPSSIYKIFEKYINIVEENTLEQFIQMNINIEDIIYDIGKTYLISDNEMIIDTFNI